MFYLGSNNHCYSWLRPLSAGVTAIVLHTLCVCRSGAQQIIQQKHRAPFNNN